MRDLLLLAVVAPGCLISLRYPFAGLLLWIWLSTMNPHRLAYGFMLQAPSAMVVAICVLIGLLRTSEKRSPFVGAPAVLFALLMVWMCITTATAIHPDSSLTMLEKVFKINLMVFVSIMLVRTKREIMAFLWVLVLSLAFYGVKGGAFTILSGGSYRVYGPSGTYIEENNALAVALIMTVPLLRFLQTQLEARWQRWAMTAAMVLCAASVLGSHSRGALLSIGAMLCVLWLRGRNKLATLVLIACAGVGALGMMPEHWWNRMETIQTYEQDASAMGRIHAWEMAFNVAKDRVTGAGFAMWRPDVYAKYKPDAILNVTAHSIYFHMMGEHGFIGLLLYLMFWISTWWTAGWLRKQAKTDQRLDWCGQLGAMTQVSLVGFAVGGAFLSLTYYDYPLNLMVVVVAARAWVASGRWKTEPEPEPASVLRIWRFRIPLGDRLVGLVATRSAMSAQSQATPRQAVASDMQLLR